MKTKWILVGVAATLASVAVLSAVRARTQPSNPTTQTAIAVATDKPERANANASADLIPIVHLETQDKLVTVQSGPAGLVYLVRAKDGKVLHENLSEEQLKAQAPDIHELINTAVAGSRSKDDSFMDARVSR